MTIEMLMTGLFGLTAVSALIVALTIKQSVEKIRLKHDTNKSAHDTDKPKH